ncbi:DUF397 domain-containing protein [Streptomyces soliscabiei]|uniref:DUF397 domain-containing protein n=1 Tax=Streptomyces soliscabiei TaxID=588897 RepID=UPI00299FD8BE|nr:DUF397 domain-containing protein [Streptomyces sp. NY05-11A]MDX2680036.1 DUF397 domain-containing protein [Streptomyces sp. NY05-11A]
MAEKPQPAWFKSTYSGSPSNECVECAVQQGTIHVRDSKCAERATLTFTHAAWATFASAVRVGSRLERR